MLYRKARLYQPDETKHHFWPKLRLELWKDFHQWESNSLLLKGTGGGFFIFDYSEHKAILDKFYCDFRQTLESRITVLIIQLENI